MSLALVARASVKSSRLEDGDQMIPVVDGADVAEEPGLTRRVLT